MEKDYKLGAIEYLEKLTQDEIQYLYTKPFCAGPCNDCAIKFYDFANLIKVLRLNSPTKILDVGCGPGWMSEYLARLGHKVTGVDINSRMIEIAKDRVASVKYTIDGKQLHVNFFVQDVEYLKVNDTFDVVIFYDSLHHFENKRKVLTNVFSLLTDGGILFIHEGVKPPKNSKEERNLRDVVEKYWTLEAPCEQSDLINLLEQIHYVDIKSYISINGLFLKGRTPVRYFEDLINNPPSMNIILGRKPGDRMFDSEDPHVLRAEITVVEAPENCYPNKHLKIRVSVKNVGDTIWLSTPNESGGFVTLGAKLFTYQRGLISDSLPRTLLSKEVKPGESIDLEMAFQTPSLPGRYILRLDMVGGLIAWFGQRESKVTDRDFYLKE